MSRGLVIVIASLATLVTLSAQGVDWSPVGMRGEHQIETVRIGADGAQVVRSLAVDATTGAFMLWGTDVGGLFRSLDGGRSWEPANVGYSSRGCTGLAIDPHNPERVLALGSNSSPGVHNGLYLSENMAASWQEVFRPVGEMANNQDERNQLVFDPSSFDEASGRSLVAYWSRAAEESAIWNKPKAHPAFYKSIDGGQTWAEVPEARSMAGSWLAVHPVDGTIFAANSSGLHRSTDGGVSWTRTLEGETSAVAVAKSSPNVVYALQFRSLHRSDDAGRTWRELPAIASLYKGEGRFRNLTVAPADPDRLVFYYHRKDWDYPRFASHDGGLTWMQSRIVDQSAFFPTNQRSGHFAFHPTNPDIILSVGGDYPTVSTDGGQSYAWRADGVCNVVVGENFNFSTINPNVVFIGSQDYATMLTSDGGKTWKYFEPGAKGWGGFNYGAYASVPETLVVGESREWGDERRLAVSTDGGGRWRLSDLAAEGGAVIGYGHPTEPATLFWGPYRTRDSGKSWEKMNGVSGVFTHNHQDGSLWGVLKGADSDQIVISRDGGEVWTMLAGSARAEIRDIAVDPRSGAVWVVQNDRLWRIVDGEWEDHSTLLPRDQAGAPSVRSVAVDPESPNVIYAATGRNFLKSSVGPVRSLDNGQTWQSLLRQEPLDGGSKDGGNESHWVRVNPVTREAWFATSCYGIWKVAAPGAVGR